MADAKDNKSVEKSTEHNKYVKQYVLALLGILVLGLVISMFKTSHTPKIASQSSDNKLAEQSIPATNFAQQVQFEQSQLNADKMRRQMPGYNSLSSDDAQWEKKERERVLNSRLVGFGVDDQQENNIRVNNAGNNNYPQSPVLYQPRYSQNNQVSSAQNSYSDTNNIDDPGANIVGRAADDSNPDAQKGNTVLIPTDTIIDGVLDQDLMSDYTGSWTGHLTQDVYSLDNQFILLPKGTKIMGQSLHVSNVNEPIQNRMGLTVEWAILPNGKRIDFRRNIPEDQTGIPAFEGSVNHHFVAQFLAVAAYATVSASGPQDQVNQSGYVQPTFQGQFADGYRAALQPFIMKYLSLVPTVTLHAGMPIKIHVQDDMYVKPWARVNTTVY